MRRAAAILVAGLLAAGCNPAPDVEEFRAHRLGWDSLEVALRFRGSTPDSVRFMLFDADYDTVLASAGSLLVVPDEELGDSEPLLLEGCGWFAARSACEQKALVASPKRVEGSLRAEYPFDGHYEQMRIELSARLNRRMSDSAAWRSVRHEPDLELAARVRNTEDAGIVAEVQAGAGTLDLSTLDGYRDFRFHLRSQFRDVGEAWVDLSVHANLPNGPILVDTTALVLRFRTEAEQLEDLGDLVERIGQAVLNAVSDREERTRSYVFVNSWAYDLSTGAYRAEIELHWRESRRRRWHELTLAFSARKEANSVNVRFVDANERAAARWETRVGQQSLDVRRSLSGD